MARKKKLTPEEQAALEVQKQTEKEASDLKDARETYGIEREPTYTFEVGEEVRLGALDFVQVTDVFDDGRIYRLYARSTHPRTGVSEKILYEPWMHIRKKGISSEIRHTQRDKFAIRYLNYSLESLLSSYYNAGVEMNPRYQRDHVWNDWQEVELIESIMTDNEIGRVVLYVNGTHRHPVTGKWLPRYEVVDGKQRLSTLIRFYEDRFTWRGETYSTLNFWDRHKFDQSPIALGEVEDLTLKGRVELFLKLNRTGVPMSRDHLNELQARLDAGEFDNEFADATDC